MKIATLACTLRNSGAELLLSEKKKGEIGTGVLAGSGGKQDPGETLEECLVRETGEELEIEIGNLVLAAILDCYAAGVLDFKVYVYLAEVISGELHETKDMLLPRWYPIGNLPFDRMYEADRHWMPQVLRREKFNANVYYRERAKGFEGIEFFPFEP